MEIAPRIEVINDLISKINKGKQFLFKFTGVIEEKHLSINQIDIKKLFIGFGD